MRRERADTHLHQPRREPLLHDARERAGVRVADRLRRFIGVRRKRVVEVGVRVEVEDGEALGAAARRPAGRDR